MNQVIAVLAIIAFVAAGTWFQYKLSRGRMWTPLWLAFGTTASALLFLVAGAIGYNLSKHERFVSGTGWTGAVIWPQVGLGLAFLLAATYFWRRSLRSLRTQ